MAEPQTYAELQAAIITWLVRDDLETLVPSFIGMAERRFNRVMRVPEMETVLSSDVTTSLTLPADFNEARSLWIDASPKVVLEQMGIAQLKAAYPTAEAGIPGSFAIEAGSIVFGPEPSDSTAVVLNYYATIPALSDSNTSNWLLTAHPDLYLAASLFEGFVYVRDSASMQIWEARTTAILGEIERQARKKAYSSTPLRLRAPNVA